jgi:hypothetical protein
MLFQELVDAKKAKVQSDFDSKIANIAAQEQKAAEDQTEFAFMDLLKPKSV